MVEPNVKKALERANKPTSGPVSLLHATNSPAAIEISRTGEMEADATGQVWLASSRDIAALVHAGGAPAGADTPGAKVEALLEVEVDAERLFWEDTREGESEQVEFFFLLGDGGTCEVTVLANEPWIGGTRNEAAAPRPETEESAPPSSSADGDTVKGRQNS